MRTLHWSDSRDWESIYSVELYLNVLSKESSLISKCEARKCGLHLDVNGPADLQNMENGKKKSVLRLAGTERFTFLFSPCLWPLISSHRFSVHRVRSSFHGRFYSVSGHCFCCFCLSRRTGQSCTPDLNQMETQKGAAVNLNDRIYY